MRPRFLAGWLAAALASAIAFFSIAAAAQADAALADAALDRDADAGADARADADGDADGDAAPTDAGAGAEAEVDAEADVDADVRGVTDLASIPLGGDVRIASPPEAGDDAPPAKHIDDVEASPPDVRAVPRGERPMVVIKTILGLVLLLVLAYLGGNERVRSFERKIGVSQLITAGFPFIALGAVARIPAVGVLTDSVLAEIAPVLRIGLGWIGFLIGFRVDASVLGRVEPGTASVAAIRSLVTVVVVVVACGSALVLSDGVVASELTEPLFLRDGLILGAAASLTSLVTPRLLAARGVEAKTVRFVAGVARFEELLGLVGLLVIAAYFRSGGADANWRIPGTAWVLLTIGLGTSIGLLLYAVLLRERTKQGEWGVVVLGSVAFAAGLSGKLQLSPVVVCFLVGLVLVNFPGTYKEGLRKALAALERPIYFVFLVVVGALWDVTDWRGWAMMGVFVVARFAGRWLGTRVAYLSTDMELAPLARRALAISPLGALSIAIVVNAQMLYPSATIPLLVTAILGGGVVTEVVFQLMTRRASNGSNGDRESVFPDDEELP